MKTLLTLLAVLFSCFANSQNQNPCLGVEVQSPFICGQNLIDSRDGKVYPTVFMNYQCWMAKNLEYDTIGAYYYMNNPAYAVYGRLYSWFTAMSGSSDFDGLPGQARGICPPGWHIPSNQEFFNLDNYYLPAAGLTGGSLKSTLTGVGVGSWILPNVGATNSTGFSAIPGGWGLPSITFQQEGNIAYFWTSTGGGDNAYYYYLESYTSELDRISVPKLTLRSVRCVMNCDFTTLPVRLLWFNASVSSDEKSVLLEWSTASESNSDLFLVERSVSGVDQWSVIGSIGASGTTTETSNYRIFDRTPIKGLNYYRLVEVDILGLHHYYSVSVVDFPGHFDPFPNPVRVGEKISLPLGQTFEILNSLGERLGEVQDGQEVGVPAGVYLLLPTDGDSDTSPAMKLVVE